MGEPRVIKRYANRKMYDTTRSCYVTLEEVADMVRGGDEVQVIDNRTKADLTEVTLTQALLDAERRRRGSVPLPGLRHLIAQGGDFLQKRVAEPVIRVREEAQRSVSAWRDQAERILHRKPEDTDGAAPEPAGSESAETAHADESAAPKRWTLQPPRGLEEWQQLLDERLRQALAGFGNRDAASHGEHTSALTELRAQLADLQRTVTALQARLDQVDGQRTPPPAVAPRKSGQGKATA